MSDFQLVVGGVPVLFKETAGISLSVAETANGIEVSVTNSGTVENVVVTEGVITLEDFVAESPADPASGKSDIMVVDDGVTPVLRIRYNDAGTVKTGDVTLSGA